MKRLGYIATHLSCDDKACRDDGRRPIYGHLERVEWVWAAGLQEPPSDLPVLKLPQIGEI